MGSSNNSSVGSMNKARAREMRMRQPPEKVFAARVCSTTSNVSAEQPDQGGPIVS